MDSAYGEVKSRPIVVANAWLPAGADLSIGSCVSVYVDREEVTTAHVW